MRKWRIIEYFSRAKRLREAGTLGKVRAGKMAVLSAKDRATLHWEMAITVGVARSEDHAQLEPENSGVFHQSRAVWPDDVLHHGLGVEPLVDLDAVVKLKTAS